MIESCAAIVIAAKHHEITKIKDARGTTNTVGALRCRFEFRTSDWDHSAKTAMFCKGDAILHPEVADSAIAVPLDRDNECAVPSEMLTDTLPYSIGVWGVTTSGIRIVSRWLVFGAQPGCYTEGGAPADPEPTMYEQILSASNVAVNVANDVLYRADSGEFDGEDGISIIKSEINNKGELVFTYSDERSVNLGGIIGASGKDGADGKDGYTPIKGVDYFDGVDGKDGHDGKDGYTPVKGVDYFTSADKSLIVDDVLSEMPDCDYSTADAILKAELQDDIADAMDRIASLEQSVPASIEIVQEMGDSETAVMSQKAVYNMWDSTQNDIYLNNESISNLWSDQAWQNVRHDELAVRVEAIENGGGASVEVVQTIGESETAVMSQKAVTAEIDAQKIKLANIKHFIPNENVLTDNSAKYRKPIPENACPYAEVKKVGGLTQRSKNLIPFPYYQESKTEKGVTFTVNENGTIIANGTATEEGAFTFLATWDTEYVPIKLNGTYTLSGVTDGLSSGSSSTYYLQLYVDGNNVAVVDKKPVTFTANGKLSQLSLFFKVGATFSNTSIMPMLNEGSVALPYTPYFSGLRDSAVTEILSEHGNLFNFENIYPTLKGENGKIIKKSGAHNIDLFGGTSGGSTPFPAEYFDKLIYLKAGTYYLYYNFEEEGLTDYTMTVLGVEGSGKVFGVGGSQITSGQTFKPTKDCYITLRVGEKTQVTITNLMITTKPQTDYIPYNPDIITIHEEIQVLEGYGIGKSESENNYIDFEKKVFDKGYGKIRLLSTMGGYNADNNWYYFAVSSLGISPVTRDVVCNVLPSVDIPANAEADGAYFNPSMSHLLLRKSEFTTQAEYRQWLADNEVYIVEKLATPVVTDVSPYLTEDNIINVEDGVFINAVNANELDAPTTVTYLLKQIDVQDALSGKVDKLPPKSGTTSAYVTTSSNEQSVVPIFYAGTNSSSGICGRLSGGRVNISSITDGNDAINVNYANEHYVPIVNGTGTVDKAYVAGADGTQKVIQIIGSGTLWGNTIAGRRSNGAVQTVAPEMEADTTTKKYVDDAIAALKAELQTYIEQTLLNGEW